MKKLRKILRILLFGFVGLCFVSLVWDKADRTLAVREKVFDQESVQYPIRKSGVTLYTDGQEFYDRLLDDIANAKQYIHISFFSIADDTVSHRFEELLKKKSKEGVEVYYAVDRLGGVLLKEQDKQALLKAGVHFTYYNKLDFPYFFSSLEHRNHKRISVIDGAIGYAGGFNIGKKYLGKNEKLGNWRDYHLRIQGEGVQDLEQEFELDWVKNDRETVWKTHTSTEKGTTELRFKAYSGKDLAYDYANLFHQAQKSITILSPYFIPNNKVIWHALIDAEKRGVEINILWSPESDAPLVKQAAYPYIRKALKHGMHVYGYRDGILHGKVLVIDERVAMVGSANLDSRSIHLNKELNCYIYDTAFIKQVLNKKVHEDFQRSQQIHSSYVNNLPLQEKLKERLAKLVEYYL